MTWKEYLLSRLDELKDDGSLDRNDPVTKAIINDPQLIAAFEKNPAKAGAARMKATKIVQTAQQKQKDPSVVAKASAIANQAGMGNNS